MQEGESLLQVLGSHCWLHRYIYAANRCFGWVVFFALGLAVSLTICGFLLAVAVEKRTRGPVSAP